MRSLITPRFGLRSLLLAFTVLCLALSWVFVPAVRQRKVLQQLEELRFSSPHPNPQAVTFSYQHNSRLWPGTPDESRYSYWMRRCFGNESFGEVVTVQLDYAEVTDDDLHSLAVLPHIRWLVLAHTKVTDVGLPHLKACQQLELLVLSNTRISDAGVPHLKNLPNLSVLQLVNTRITDESVPIIGSFSNLKELYIETTNISEEGFQKLKVALPGCTIHWEPAPN